jgi:hypothetical protein
MHSVCSYFLGITDPLVYDGSWPAQKAEEDNVGEGETKDAMVEEAVVEQVEVWHKILIFAYYDNQNRYSTRQVI